MLKSTEIVNGDLGIVEQKTAFLSLLRSPYIVKNV
jgi:hypothetical protein